MTDTLLAIDAGTTGVNAMLFDTEGRSCGASYREYPSLYPAEHQVLQDAEEIVAKSFEVCRETVEKSGVEPKNIRAVAISSQRATFGLLGQNGRLLENRFIGWQDNRAHDVMAEMGSILSADELYQTTGMPLAPTYTLGKLVWIGKNRPDMLHAAEKVVFPADYVLWRFGADSLQTEVTNACCSGMIDIRTLDWSDRVLDAFGISRKLFAPLVYPGTVLGRVSAATSALTGLAEGTLLVSATGDQQCAAIGAGVIDEGLASLTLGTAGLLVVGTKQLELAKCPGLMVPSSGRVGLYELEGIQLGAAACYRWVRDQLAIPEKEQAARDNGNPFGLMERLLEQSLPGANGIVFLPFLSGAGFPLWDPMAQGVFAGLRFSHNREDMMRSVVEGVTLESFDMYQRMKQAGVEMKSLTITGGATASPIWCQTIADIFDMEIRPLEVPNATLVASAIFAGIGAGIFRDVEEGVAKTVRYAKPLRPNPDNVRLYRKTYAVYKGITEALQERDLFRGLVQLRET